MCCLGRPPPPEMRTLDGFVRIDAISKCPASRAGEDGLRFKIRPADYTAWAAGKAIHY